MTISKTTKAHLHDLMNRLGELQSRIVMEAGPDRCMEKLNEAIAEVRALTVGLESEGTVIAERQKMKLSEFLCGLKAQSDQEMQIMVAAMIEASSEVYGCKESLDLITGELIRNAHKAHAKRLSISVSERGGHTYKVLFHDDGSGMTKPELDNLGFGPRQEGRGGHGVSLLRGLVHEIGGHINWLPTVERLGGGSMVTLTLEKAHENEQGKI